MNKLSKKEKIQRRKKIEDYLNIISNGVTIGDINFLNTLKEDIGTRHPGEYVQDIVIAPIDRHIEELKKYQDINIRNKNMKIIVNYFESILENKEHKIHKYLTKAFENNYIHSGWGEDIYEVLKVVKIFEKIIFYFYLLELLEQDEKELLVASRDKHKLDKAIETLKKYANNAHLNFYLSQINSKGKATKSVLLSCFFYELTRIFIDLKMNNSQSTKLSLEIMSSVFDSTKDNRIYKNTQSIHFKDLELLKYTAK